MKLIRYNPTTNTRPNIDVWDQLFDLSLQNFVRPSTYLNPVSELISKPRQVPVDLFEAEDAFHARFEVPGFSKESIQLKLENSLLTVRLKNSEFGTDDGSAQSYERSVAVPDGIEVDAVSASLEAGILTVSLPKAKSSKPRTIEIQ